MLLDHRGTAAVPEQRSVPLSRLSAERLGFPWRSSRPAWVDRYRAVLIALEVLAAAAAAGGVLLVHAEAPASSVLFWASGALVAVWPVLLAAVGAHSERVFGTGSE